MNRECALCFRSIDDDEPCVPIVQLHRANSEPVQTRYAHLWHFQQIDTDDDE